jgi:hypothetical protein
LQCVAPTSEPGPNRADRHVQRLRNLAVRESFHVGQHDHDAVMLGQRGQRSIQILAQQFVEKFLLWIGEPQQEGLVQTLEDRECALLVAGLLHQQLFPRTGQRLPSLADKRVVQDPEYPRPKGSCIRQLCAGLPRARDGLGHEVLRIGLVLRQTPGHPVQRTKDLQNLGFKGFFRNGHAAPAPKTRGPAKWFQWSDSMTAPRIVAGISAQFQRIGTISQTAASSAVNHGERAAAGWRRST